MLEGDFRYIADSALITEENLQALGDDTVFISRLPGNYHECGRVITQAVKAQSWNNLGILAQTNPTKTRPGASSRAYESAVTLDEKPYRAVVLHSSAHDGRRQKRIEREVNV